jgi:hypothetical protein
VRESVLKLRRAAVAAVAALSVAMALFLVWYLVTPARIGAAPLTGLLGVLALMILPGATLAAWELDRRALARVPAHRTAASRPRPLAASIVPAATPAGSGAPVPVPVTDLGELEIAAPEPAAEPRPARIHERPAPAPEPRHRHRIAGDRTRQS